MAGWESAFTTPPAEFDRQMALLESLGYRSVTMREVASAWEKGLELPKNAVALTFDDGFDCLLHTALPIMQRRGLTPTVYVIAGCLGQPNQYDRALDPTPRRILDGNEVRLLHSSGVEIGSHTMSHRRLTGLDDEQTERELIDSRKLLEDLLGSPVKSFAYPYGAYTKKARDFAQACGYSSAVSTMSGRNNARTDRFLLRRVTIGAGHSDRAFLRMLRWGGEPTEVAVSGIKRHIRARLVQT